MYVYGYGMGGYGGGGVHAGTLGLNWWPVVGASLLFHIFRQ
jgi:hypothetical protein